MTTEYVFELRARLVEDLATSGDGEKAALALLLTCTPISCDPKFAGHVTDDGIDFPAILEEGGSATERFLITTGYGLWSSSPDAQADTSRLRFLDDQQMALFTAMVTAARTGQVLTPGHGIQ
jgi:hypothetical protein